MLVDRFFQAVEADCVHIDNFQAAYKSVEHLIKNRRRKIAMIAYETSLPPMQERINGYKAVLKANGISYKNEWLSLVSYEHISKNVAEKMKKLLYPVLKVDAFLFATNSLAIESLKIINQEKIKVPEDLAIKPFEESDAFDFFSPLSYVSQSLGDIARTAVKLIINKIDTGNQKKYTTIIGKEKLVLRESPGNKN